jgi:predicted NBD/HSP70 family sugar kinase
LSVEVARNQVLLKAANRMSIVRRLCAGPGMSRSDLATALGLTRSTVTRLVRELLAEGWLMEREMVITGDPGRRPTPLFIDPHRLLLLGAEVGVGTLRVVATSLLGEVHERLTVGFAADSDASDCMEQLAGALLGVFERIHAPDRRAIGICIGLPGGVDEARGVLRSAPHLGWHGVSVARILRQKLEGSALGGVPLFARNEADVAAMGEVEFNAPEAAEPLLYLSLNQGLGAGVIVRGNLLTGSRAFAGEVGHVVLQMDGPPCSCGRRGCAQTLISARALSGSAKAIEEAGRYLGMLLQNLVAAYDPGCIVLGGGLVDLGDTFLEPARRTLRDCAAAAGLSPPLLRTSRFGPDAVAVGAAALARYRLMHPLAAGSVAVAPAIRPRQRAGFALAAPAERVPESLTGQTEAARPRIEPEVYGQFVVVSTL